MPPSRPFVPPCLLAAFLAAAGCSIRRDGGEPGDDDGASDDDSWTADDDAADDDDADDDAADDDATPPPDDDAADDDAADDDATPPPDDDATAEPHGDVTYLFDLGDGTLVAPSMLPVLVPEGLSGITFLAMPFDFTATRVDLLFGTGHPSGTTWVQDLDYPTQTAPDAFWDEPDFETAAPVDFILPTPAGVGLELVDVDLIGHLVGGGTSLEFDHLSGWIDARQFGELGYSGTEICLFLEYFGEPCASCPGDGADLCIPFEMTDLVGIDVPGLELVEVD